MELIGDCRPPHSPEQVDAIDEHGRLVLADVRDRKWLPDTVRLCYQVAVHQGDFEAVSTAPHPHGLVKVRQSEDNRATRSAGADNQDPHGAFAHQVARKNVLDAHATPALRVRTAL